MKTEQGLVQFKTEAEFEAYKKANPGVRIERMIMAAHPACPYCYGTGKQQSFQGGIVKVTQCKCVKPRLEKYRREHNVFPAITKNDDFQK